MCYVNHFHRYLAHKNIKSLARNTVKLFVDETITELPNIISDAAFIRCRINPKSNDETTQSLSHCVFVDCMLGFRGNFPKMNAFNRVRCYRNLYLNSNISIYSMELVLDYVNMLLYTREEELKKKGMNVDPEVRANIGVLLALLKGYGPCWDTIPYLEPLFEPSFAKIVKTLLGFLVVEASKNLLLRTALKDYSSEAMEQYLDKMLIPYLRQATFLHVDLRSELKDELLPTQNSAKVTQESDMREFFLDNYSEFVKEVQR